MNMVVLVALLDTVLVVLMDLEVSLLVEVLVDLVRPDLEILISASFLSSLILSLIALFFSTIRALFSVLQSCNFIFFCFKTFGQLPGFIF